MRVHQLLELRDRRRVDVDTGDLGVRRVGREAGQRRGAGYPEQEGQQGRENEGNAEVGCSSRDLHGIGWVDAGIAGFGPAIWGLDSITVMRAERFAVRLSSATHRRNSAPVGATGTQP